MCVLRPSHVIVAFKLTRPCFQLRAHLQRSIGRQISLEEASTLTVGKLKSMEKTAKAPHLPFTVQHAQGADSGTGVLALHAEAHQAAIHDVEGNHSTANSGHLGPKSPDLHIKDGHITSAGKLVRLSYLQSKKGGSEVAKQPSVAIPTEAILHLSLPGGL